MKNFICTIPQQPKAKLEDIQYLNPCDNPVLGFDGTTKFPIFVLILNTAKKGEKIRITAVRPDYENCHINFETFVNDLEKLKERIGFECEIDVVDTHYSERIDDHLDLFGKLIDTVQDQDEIYADISYGTKPIPIIVLMMLTYAYRFRGGIIENIIYGQVDHNPAQKRGWLYDVTALFYMNSTINTMNDSSDPKMFIKKMLDF